MNEFIDSARAAREQLAAALAILQTPEAGDLMDTVAAPVARAMGALHRIESSKGASVTDDGAVAQEAVRQALAALQEAPADNPVVDQATEKVASSLGVVHTLATEAKATQMDTAEQPKTEPPEQQQKARPAEASAQASAPEVKEKAAPEKKEADAASAFGTTQMPDQPANAPAPQVSKPADPLDQTQLAPSQPQRKPSQADPLQSTQVSEDGSDQTQASQVAPQGGQSPNRIRQDSKRAPSPSKGPSANATHVEANLGAHSPTNFYKGLSGNDVIDDGGIFIATYQIPDIGSPLWIKVTMPGGYEFEASGVVRWTRESGAEDAPPGFGAAFESVSKEARQLVYRYVRNREPLFHDDL